MIKHKIYEAYNTIDKSIVGECILAAKNGDINLLTDLFDNLPNEAKQDIIAYNDYEMFIWAANNGCLEIIDKLLEEVHPFRKQEMIVSNHFEALECAVGNDHLQVVKRLLEEAVSEQRSNMIAMGADIALRRNIMDMLGIILEYASEDEKAIILEEAMELGLIEGNHYMY